MLTSSAPGSRTSRPWSGAARPPDSAGRGHRGRRPRRQPVPRVHRRGRALAADPRLHRGRPHADRAHPDLQGRRGVRPAVRHAFRRAASRWAMRRTWIWPRWPPRWRRPWPGSSSSARPRKATRPWWTCWPRPPAPSARRWRRASPPPTRWPRWSRRLRPGPRPPFPCRPSRAGPVTSARAASVTRIPARRRRALILGALRDAVLAARGPSERFRGRVVSGSPPASYLPGPIGRAGARPPVQALRPPGPRRRWPRRRRAGQLPAGRRTTAGRGAGRVRGRGCGAVRAGGPAPLEGRDEAGCHRGDRRPDGGRPGSGRCGGAAVENGTGAVAAVIGAADEQADILAALPERGPGRPGRRRAPGRSRGRGPADRGARPCPPPDGDFILVGREVDPADLIRLADAGPDRRHFGFRRGQPHSAIIARGLGLPMLAGVDPAVARRSRGPARPARRQPGPARPPPGPPDPRPRPGPPRRPSSRDSNPRLPTILRTSRAPASQPPPRATISLSRHCRPSGTPDRRRPAGHAAGQRGLGPRGPDGAWPRARPASGCCAPRSRSSGAPPGPPRPSTRRPWPRRSGCWPAARRWSGCSTSPATRSRRSWPGPGGQRQASGLTACWRPARAAATSSAPILAAGRATDLRIMVPMVHRGRAGPGPGGPHRGGPARSSPARSSPGRSGRSRTGRRPGPGRSPARPWHDGRGRVHRAGAAAFAGSAGFFSIGTNDLTSQVLGIDRADPRMRPGLAADPRVLAVLRDVATAAAAARSRCRCAATPPPTRRCCRCCWGWGYGRSAWGGPGAAGRGLDGRDRLGRCADERPPCWLRPHPPR